MTNFASSSAAVDFLETAYFGSYFMIDFVQFRVTKWNHDHIIASRIDGKEFRYNFKSC